MVRLQPELDGLLEVLGLREEPLGVYYADAAPPEATSPRPGALPSREQEARGEVDFEGLFRDFSCVMGHLWRARKQGRAAVFDRDRFGCLGGAFYLGFLPQQLEFINYYVSTGIPGQMEGERYLESPHAVRRFQEAVAPRPAPARYCIFKPLSHFAAEEQPEVVIFFARPESLSGLHFLTCFVTNDMEAVMSPFGADCSYIVTWPLTYLAQGKRKAVLGGFDPSGRKFHRPDELSFAIPWGLFQDMVGRWRQSFLTGHTWETVQKKIALSRKTWKDE